MSSAVAAAGRWWLSAALLALVGMALIGCGHGGATAPGSPAAAAAETVPPGWVVLYMRPDCPYCRQALELLIKRGVPFVERDVTHDRRSYNELLEIYRQRLPDRTVLVPLLLIGDTAVGGFDEEEIDAALKAMPRNGGS